MSADGCRSGQMDVLVVRGTVPRLAVGDACLGLAHGVAATLEVKSTLTTGGDASELSKSLQSCESLKRLPIQPLLDPWPWSASVVGRGDARLNNIPYSLVAFDGPEAATLLRHLDAFAGTTEKQLLPNTVTCLRRNYTLTLTDGWVYPATANGPLYQQSTPDQPALLDVFDYVMKILQAWSFTAPRTPFNAYR